MSVDRQGFSSGPLAVFRNRNFALLWTAQFITTMGGGLTMIASSILVYRVTGSAFSVGLMMLSASLPGFFVGPIAGVFVDRFDRKKIMIGAEIIRAVLIAMIPLLLPYGIGWLYAIVILSSTVAQFYAPAEASVLPEIASDQELAATNSMMAVSGVGALTIGFATAGLLATESSINLAFYFDAATFLASAVCICSSGCPAFLSKATPTSRPYWCTFAQASRWSARRRYFAPSSWCSPLFSSAWTVECFDPALRHAGP